MKKKANVNKLTGYALMFVVLTLILAIGLNVLSTLRDTGRTTGSAFESGNSFTALNSTAVDFSDWNQLTCSGVLIRNSTNASISNTSIMTTSGCTATLVNNDFNNTVFTANYTFSHYVYDSQYNATSSNITHIGSIPSWIPIIIVALVGGIVLFLVIRQFSAG